MAQRRAAASEIQFCTLMFRCVHHSAPRSVLCDFLTPVANVAARSQLRSARRHLVVVPRYTRSTHGSRAFFVAGPATWNCKFCHSPHRSATSRSRSPDFRPSPLLFLLRSNALVFSALGIFYRCALYIDSLLTFLLTVTFIFGRLQLVYVTDVTDGWRM